MPSATTGFCIFFLCLIFSYLPSTDYSAAPYEIASLSCKSVPAGAGVVKYHAAYGIEYRNRNIVFVHKVTDKIGGFGKGNTYIIKLAEFVARGIVNVLHMVAGGFVNGDWQVERIVSNAKYAFVQVLGKVAIIIVSVFGGGGIFFAAISTSTRKDSRGSGRLWSLEAEISLLENTTAI